MTSKKNLFRVLGILVSLFVLGLFAMSLLIQKSAQSFFTTEIQVYGLLISFLVSAILEFVPQYIAPHFILLDASIINLPLSGALLLVILGSSFGSILGFELGKKHGFGFACSLYGKEKIRKTQSLLNSKGKWIVALAAISPIPYVPIIFGSLGMKRKIFITHGVFPRALSFIAVYLFIILYQN